MNERGGESTVSTNRFFLSFVSFLFDKPSNPKIQKPKKKKFKAKWTFLLCEYFL